MARFGLALFSVITVMMVVKFQEASALKCWKCASKFEISCLDPFKGEEIPNLVVQEECKGEEVCVKIRNSMLGFIERGCVSKQGHEACNLMKNPLIKTMDVVSCDECDTDLCNSATQFGWIAFRIVVPVIILKFFLL